MTNASKAARALGRLGGKARDLKLSDERKRDIARKAGQASGAARKARKKSNATKDEGPTVRNSQ